jgi:hypothetical protein
MANSPFSTAGGGNADAKPHDFAARKCGGAVKNRAEGGSATLKEAKGKKSIGFVEGEDAKPRLDRKRGGKVPFKGGRK